MKNNKVFWKYLTTCQNDCYNELNSLVKNTQLNIVTISQLIINSNNSDEFTNNYYKVLEILNNIIFELLNFKELSYLLIYISDSNTKNNWNNIHDSVIKFMCLFYSNNKINEILYFILNKSKEYNINLSCEDKQFIKILLSKFNEFSNYNNDDIKNYNNINIKLENTDKPSTILELTINTIIKQDKIVTDSKSENYIHFLTKKKIKKIKLLNKC
jgi:hypothetical protein